MPVDPTDIVRSAAAVTSSETIRGTLTEAWQALLGDKIAAWRLSNAAKTQLKVAEQFKKLGLKPNMDRIPERFAVTWFEEASKQDEDEIQELFAKLLARAAEGNADALDRRNLEIVSKLTPIDAALFQELAEGGWSAQVMRGEFYWEENKKLRPPSESVVPVEEFPRSFEHLVSVGLLKRTTLTSNRYDGRGLRRTPASLTSVDVKNIFGLTEAAKSLHGALTE
ncbi:MAG: Abi-alpha family protein [Pseudomonadota bacterium]